jgi:uncharacterized protein YjfI (DUF2170 family)
MVNVSSLLLFLLLSLLSLSSPFNFDSYVIKNSPPLSKICVTMVDIEDYKAVLGEISNHLHNNNK